MENKEFVEKRNMKLVEKLEKHIEELGMGGQKKVSVALGHNTSAAICQYLKGVYKSVLPLEMKLTEYFETLEASEKLSSMDEYVPTTISEQVYMTIRNCHIQGGLAIECGDPGIGKTKAIKKYVADYPSSAIMITVNPCFSSVTSFLKLLCRTLHVSEARRDDMWINCASRLVGGKVLIIDEAQHLPPKTIELIRALADYVDRLGIVFVGNRTTIDNMSGGKEAVFAQITSRLKQRKIRFTSQIQESDIELLFPRLAGKAEKQLLLEIARSKQGIRGASNLYNNATDNGNISYKGLIAMAKYMELNI